MEYEYYKKLAMKKLNEIFSNDLKNDIEHGERLLVNCNKNLLECPIKSEALEYMKEMNNKYGIFNLLYNYENGYISSVSNGSECQNLGIQIKIIKIVKQAMDEEDSMDKIDEILKSLKNLK